MVKKQREPALSKPADKQLGVRIPRDLYKRLKLRAVHEDRPMTSLLVDALEAYLARTKG